MFSNGGGTGPGGFFAFFGISLLFFRRILSGLWNSTGGQLFGRPEDRSAHHAARVLSATSFHTRLATSPISHGHSSVSTDLVSALAVAAVLLGVALVLTARIRVRSQ